MPARKRAAIIGINEYNDPELPRLKGAVNDAMDMRKRLIDFGKFEVADNHFLLDKEATRTAICKAFSDLFWKTDPCDLALFYFSGHGIVDGYNNGYIAPCDMLKNEPFVCSITHRELQRVLLQSVSKTSVMILDSCYSGGATTDKAPANVKEAYRPFEELQKEITAEGKIILTSTDDQTVAKERPNCKHEAGESDHDHGAFTFHLIEGLDGRAANQCGIITLGELINHVHRQFAGNERQKPRVMVSGGFQWEDIRIALAPKKHNDYIGELMKQVELCDRDHPLSLFVAARLIHQILDASPQNAEALACRKEINDILERWRDKANGWLFANRQRMIAIAIRPPTRFKIERVCQELQGLTGYLNFDSTNKLDEGKKNLLADLCSVSIEKLDIKSFVNTSCRYYDNPPSRLKPPST